MGHYIAATLIDSFTDALKKLVELEPSTPETPQQKYDRLLAQLQQLDKEEAADYQRIFESPLPEELKRELVSNWDPEENPKAAVKLPKGMDFLTLATAPNFCHFAKLPAEIRFKGLLTESDITGDVRNQHYDKGIWPDVLEQYQNKSLASLDGASPYVDPRPGHGHEMTLVIEEAAHTKNCSEQTSLDFKDFFQVATLEDWRSLTLPNDAELKYYNEYNPISSHGWIMACLKICKKEVCCAVIFVYARFLLLTSTPSYFILLL